MHRQLELMCRRGPAAGRPATGRSVALTRQETGCPETRCRFRGLLRGLGELAAQAIRVARVRRASWVLFSDASSASTARRLIRAQLADWGYDEQSEIAELLVSELVTNALLHGWGEPVLTLSSQDGTLRCEVEDENPAPPRVAGESEDDESGRGMLLVDLLSHSWGTGHPRRGAGKAVWFELSTHPASPVS
ncbi:ATP-binding protein [Streptosporangium sp. NPDC087985]|uniref:ATP-binding protein n=1 Tax=Streptosporangium sp. NPDC087985 TaxID=3366196 RepID=UPI0037F51BC1